MASRRSSDKGRQRHSEHLNHRVQHFLQPEEPHEEQRPHSAQPVSYQHDLAEEESQFWHAADEHHDRRHLLHRSPSDPIERERVRETPMSRRLSTHHQQHHHHRTTSTAQHDHHVTVATSSAAAPNHLHSGNHRHHRHESSESQPDSPLEPRTSSSRPQHQQSQSGVHSTHHSTHSISHGTQTRPASPVPLHFSDLGLCLSAAQIYPLIVPDIQDGRRASALALGISSLSVGSDYGGFGTGSGSGGLLLQHCSSSGYVAGGAGSGGSTLKLTGRPRSVRSVRSTHSDQQTQTNGRQRSTPRSRSRTPRSRYYASADEEDDCGYFCGSTGTRRDAKAKEAAEDDEATLREMLVRFTKRTIASISQKLIIRASLS